jgi:hypothetical protein
MVQAVLSPFLSPQSWDSITVGGLTWGNPTSQIQATNVASAESAFFADVANSLAITGVLDGFATQGGSIEIEGAERFYSWDPKHGKGQDGHTPTFQGNKPKPFRLIFKMWTDAQFFSWQVFQLAFQYDKTALLDPPKPVSIVHPSLTLLGISAIYCNSIGQVRKVSDQLMFQSIVTVTQYLPPPPRNVASTPVGAITLNPINISGKAPNPAIAEKLKQIAALKATAAGAATSP